jgi:hypothetical protein
VITAHQYAPTISNGPAPVDVALLGSLPFPVSPISGAIIIEGSAWKRIGHFAVLETDHGGLEDQVVLQEHRA